MNYVTTSDIFSFGTIIAIIVFIITGLAAWFTHVVVCIKTASYIFLIAGAIAAPIGMIHGVGIWLGIW